MTAALYGFLTYYAFPDTWHDQTWRPIVVGICTAMAIALGNNESFFSIVTIFLFVSIVGTMTVGTLGPRQCSFIWPLFGAFLGLPLLIRRFDEGPSFNIPVLFCCIIFEWKVEWNTEYFQMTVVTKPNEPSSSVFLKETGRKRRHIVKRCLFYTLGAFVFTGIFASAMYQNLHVDINGQRMKIKDVLADFFKSQEFLLLYEQLKRILRHLITFYMQYGVKGIWNQIWTILNFENERQAFKVNLFGN